MSEYIKQNYGLDDESLKKAQADYDRLSLWLPYIEFYYRWISRISGWGCFVCLATSFGIFCCSFMVAERDPEPAGKVGLFIFMMCLCIFFSYLCYKLWKKCNIWENRFIRRFRELEVLAGQTTTAYFNANPQNISQNTNNSRPPHESYRKNTPS